MNSSIFSEAFLKELGVLDWGYTEEAIPSSYNQYQDWTSKDLHTPLGYLNDHRKEIRSDLRKVYPDFQSALVFLFSYRPTKKWMLENDKHRIAAYALGYGGEDYHQTLKRKLTQIHEELKKQHPEIEAFITLDAQPVLERDLAFRAGLGWFGKNSMLISRHEGSYFIIGSLLLNQKLPLTSRALDTDHCGTCTACADACPTNAIDLETRTLRAKDCISTFTIEVMKEAEPPAGFEKSRGEIFGCDICQDVCPWNRKPLEKEDGGLVLSDHFLDSRKFLDLPLAELKSWVSEMTGRGFQKVMQGSALSRPGKKGWLKNLR